MKIFKDGTHLIWLIVMVQSYSSKKLINFIFPRSQRAFDQVFGGTAGSVYHCNLFLTLNNALGRLVTSTWRGHSNFKLFSTAQGNFYYHRSARPLI